MNPDNRASLPASRCLVEAGIVLETEAYWWKAHKRIDWILQYKNVGIGDMLTKSVNCVPAPSMAEVWRELPERINDRYLHFTKMNDKAYTYYGAIWNPLKSTENDNPTDALIDLLIWVRKEKAIDAQEGANENKD